MTEKDTKKLQDILGSLSKDAPAFANNIKALVSIVDKTVKGMNTKDAEKFKPDIENKVVEINKELYNLKKEADSLCDTLKNL